MVHSPFTFSSTQDINPTAGVIVAIMEILTFALGIILALKTTSTIVSMQVITVLVWLEKLEDKAIPAL